MSTFQKRFRDLKAEAAAMYEFSHTAMQPSRHNTFAGPGGTDGNFHIRHQDAYLKSIAFARILEANNPAVSAAGNRLVNNVNVGEMMPQPDTGSKDMDQHLAGKWASYILDTNWCCSQGRFTYVQQADITFRRAVFDGDLFPTVDKDNDAAVLHLEGHRCQTPMRIRKDRGVCGVVRRKGRNRVSHYWLAQKQLAYGQRVSKSDAELTPVFNKDGWQNCVQVFNPKMFSLDRGFSALGAVGTSESRRDDIEYANVLRGQTASCITLIEKAIDPVLIKELIEKGLAEKENADFPEAEQATHFEKDDAGFDYATADIHPGRVLRPRLGYEIDLQSPDITAEGQLELNILLLQYLAMVLDLPLIVLLLDARMSSFSTFRGIMDLARDAFTKHRDWFSNQYHRFRYNNLIRSEIKKDREVRRFMANEENGKPVADPRRSKIFRHTWHGKAYRYYHPVDDAMGDLIQLANGMKSIDKFSRDRYGVSGMDHATSIMNLNTDILRGVLKRAKKLIEDYPEFKEQISIHLLYPFPNVTGMHLNFTQDTNQTQPAEGGQSQVQGASK